MDSIKTKVDKLVNYGKSQLQEKGVESTATNMRGVLDDISNIQQGGGGDQLKGLIEKTITELSSNTITKVTQKACSGQSNLKTINLPNVETIERYGFEYCKSLETVIIPNVKFIGTYAFQYISGMKLFDFREATAIPQLESYQAFYGCSITFDIVVPDNLYDEWKVTTNWTSFSNKIIKASEYTGA